MDYSIRQGTENQEYFQIFSKNGQKSAIRRRKRDRMPRQRPKTWGKDEETIAKRGKRRYTM
ncbi:MAG: hypothetical protein IJ259_05910, partial [Oscillospiraceae bacterium]|nr:hypothetical protein [Oscillospiraceae bacterium]